MTCFVCIPWFQRISAVFFCWASRPETWLWARHASFSRAWNLPFRNIETTHLAGAFLGTLRSGIHTKKMLGFMNQYSALTEISCIYSHFTLKSSTQQEMYKSFNVQTFFPILQKQTIYNCDCNKWMILFELPIFGTFTGSTQAGFEGLEKRAGQNLVPGKKKTCFNENPKNYNFPKTVVYDSSKKKLSFPKYGGNMNSTFAVVDSHGLIWTYTKKHHRFSTTLFVVGSHLKSHAVGCRLLSPSLQGSVGDCLLPY